MPIKIGGRTDHGFDTPLGLLTDCHRRIEHFLQTLVTIADVRRGERLGDADRAALEAALRYFDTAGPRHSADEEDSLFPRLRAVDDPSARAACDAVHRLEADHRRAEQHHEAVAVIGRRWLDEGTLPEAEIGQLRTHLSELQHLYREHIAVEDTQVFPVAGRVLKACDLEAVGREMAARRGITLP
jgi:hemerythrin-like domain-containing protein